MGVVFWYMDEILSCGYVDRTIQGALSENSELPDYAKYSPQNLAGTALISLLFKRVLSYERSVGTEYKAPPFRTRKGLETFRQIQDWRSLRLLARPDLPWEDISSGDQRLIPKRIEYRYEWPELLDQHKHNEAQTIDHQKSDDFISEPWTWIPAALLAEWIDEFWSLQSSSRLVLEKYARAQARMRGWQGQLEAYGKVGAKVVLVAEEFPINL
ncbi:MAG: hypothetical protein AAGA35_04215 [Patescibacteria group bacterium]